MDKAQIIALASAHGRKLLTMTYSKTYRYHFYPGGSGDCSSFVGCLFFAAGYPLLNKKRGELWTSTYQVNASGFDLIYPDAIGAIGRDHAPASLYKSREPGDVLFFDFAADDRANTVDHVGFVADDGQVIQESGSRNGVNIDPLSYGRNNTVAILRLRPGVQAMEAKQITKEDTTKLLTRRLQILLNVTPINPRLVCDAKWGTLTQMALNVFKQSHGLEPDGVCGADVWALLIGATPESTPAEARDLTIQTPYLRGADVTALQKRLAAIGYDPGEIDGAYGPKTASAVDAIKSKASAVTSPDGVSDAPLRALLNL